MISAPALYNRIFLESSFFKHHAEFPSFEEIRERSRLNTGPKPHIIAFGHLNLLVKFGTWNKASIAEGQCLYMIRCELGNAVPVPEIYGWKTDGHETFLYMELVEGVTLEKAWDTLSCDQRTAVCRDVRQILDTSRKLKQEDQRRPYIGHIDRNPLQDIALPLDAKPAGPFLSVSAFNDWFSGLYRRNLKNPDSATMNPFRSALPDDVPTTFTHGDLHPSNILISFSEGSPRVACLIDRHQAGWLPAYWEVCKAIYTAWPGSEWELKYVPMFLDVCDSTFEAWDFYVAACGN